MRTPLKVVALVWLVLGFAFPHGAVRKGLLGNHDIAPTLADMGNARTPSFVDRRSFLPLAKGTVCRAAENAPLLPVGASPPESGME